MKRLFTLIFLIAGFVSTAFSGGEDALSDIVSAGNEPSGIAYGSYQAGVINTTSDALRVFSFTIRDGGGTPDSDTEPTILTSIVFDKGVVTSWASAIREAALFNGTTKIAEVSVTGESITFSGLSGNEVTAPDNGTLTLDLYLTFESAVTDNEQFQFQIQSSNVTAAPSGSSLFTNFPAVLSSVSGNLNKIVVTATKLAFVQQPTDVPEGLTMAPAVTVQAVDGNNNPDEDYATGISITATASALTGSPVTEDPVSGLSTFASLVLTTADSNVTLVASSGGLTSATSQSFIVKALPQAGEIIINQFSPDYNGDSDEYIELINTTERTFDLSLLKIEYESDLGLLGSAGGELTGVIGPYEFWLLSTNPTVTVGETEDLPRDGAIAAGFAGSSGQLALRLKDSPYTEIDGLAYGNVTQNDLGESLPTSSPTTDGGLERYPEGSDSNDNSVDFATVAQASIYLHCRYSLFIVHDYTLRNSTYNNISLAWWNPQVQMSRNTSLSGKLKVMSGNLRVGAGQTLTVSGKTSLDTSPGLTLKSDASGTGSFIDNGTITGSGTARMERYLSADGWHFVSSPMEYATANVFLNDYLRTSDPTASDGWGAWIVEPSTSLAVMRGYGCWKPSSNPSLETFTGDFNTGTLSFTGSRNESDPYAGWHLVGNPYPSAINLTSGNITWGEFDYAAYFWDEGGSGNPDYPSGNYNVALATPPYFGTHSRYAPAEQSFFLHISDSYEGSTTFTVRNSTRVHSSEPFLKEAPAVVNGLMLSVTGNVNKYSDRLTLLFRPDATAGYDRGMDAVKLAGLSEAPQLYTNIQDRKVTCNALPFSSRQTRVPLGFSCGLAGTYTLRADSLQTFESGITVLLEDLKTGVLQDLRLTPEYSFAYQAEDDPARFILHFTNPAFGIDNQGGGPEVRIYSFGRSVVIKSEDVDLRGSEVRIYNMIGEAAFSGVLEAQWINRYTPDLRDGYYIVQVITKSGTFSVKVYLGKK